MSSETRHLHTPISDEEELPCFLGDGFVAEDLPPIFCVRIDRPAVVAAPDQEFPSQAELWTRNGKTSTKT
jgi:hypothetical protein